MNNPKIRHFKVYFGGGARSDVERPGKTFWPHAITVRLRKQDIEDMVIEGVKWLTENGALHEEAREPFYISTMGDVVETDEEGEPLA